MKPPPLNLAHSVHDRLLELARRRRRSFHELLQYYAMERFLYRLSKSPARTRFVLKGALILTARQLTPYRPTRDIDLLGRTANTEENLAEQMRCVCRQEVPDDGLVFDPDSVSAARIVEGAEYAGVRVTLRGRLGSARVNMQVDVGFGDAVSPAPAFVTYPALLDAPPPRLRAYALETVAAEKLHAMVRHGELNSRLKDFFDIWTFLASKRMDPDVLAEAIRRTFQRRKTVIPDRPACFTDHFAQAREHAWRGLLAKLQVDHAPERFTAVIRDLRTELRPVLAKAARPS